MDPNEQENLQEEVKDQAAAQAETNEAAETPEEEEKKKTRRKWIIIAVIVLVLLFAGNSYYRSSVLPGKNYDKATALLQEGKYEEAANLFKEAADNNYEDKKLYLNLGKSLEGMGKTDEAIEAYKKYLEQNPEDAEAAMNLANLLIKNGAAEEGFAMLEKAVEKDPKNAAAWEAILAAAEETGDKDKAVRALKELAFLKEEPDEIYGYITKLMDLGAWKEVVECAEHEKLADDPRAREAMALAKDRLGIPTDPSAVIVPGKSLANINIGMTKAEVKEAVGRPKLKVFKNLGDMKVEEWVMGPEFDEETLRILFIKDKVAEIESESEKYRTAEGLGLHNFLLPEKESVVKREELENGGIKAVLAGKDGITFYAQQLAEDGASAGYSKLRVHEGSTSAQDGVGISILSRVDATQNATE